MNITLLGTILIVEDSPSELKLMSHYLMESGYNVIQATGAKEALEKAQSQNPDVIVTDVVMPGMSGFVAELIVFFGILTSQKYLLMTKILITFVMAIGMILTPIYSLSMLRQMFYGYKLFTVTNSYFVDSGPREFFVSISILLPVIAIGIYPDFVFSLSVDKVEALLSNYFYP